MNDKQTILDEENKNSFYMPLVEKKIIFFKNVIEKTVLHVQKNKFLDILGIRDVCSCIEKLGEISKKIEDVIVDKLDNETLVNYLQTINNDLSGIVRSYGTEKLEDLLLICFGSNQSFLVNEKEEGKMELLKKYFHPTSYKVASKREECKTTGTSASVIEDKDKDKSSLSCSDISATHKHFNMKIYGVKLTIYNANLKKTLIIYGIVDDVVTDILSNKYIKEKKKQFIENKPLDTNFADSSFHNFISSLILKDYLICDSEHEIYAKYASYVSQNNSLTKKPVSVCVKEFIASDMYIKRNTLVCLLIFSTNYENQYLSYLLYDLLSNDANGMVDTQEQTVLFDSFPWFIKQFFKEAMKKTIQYTNDLSNFDLNKIPLEQQICLLKANDAIKEKAMMKLKEVKAKSEDSGSKARQYLDGLLKIPFSVYKREPILNIMDTVRTHFKNMYNKYNLKSMFPMKENYTSVEVLTYINKIQNKQTILNEELDKVKTKILKGNKNELHNTITIVNNVLKKYENTNTNVKKIKYSSLNKNELKKKIEEFIEVCKQPVNLNLCSEILKELSSTNTPLTEDISIIHEKMQQITNYMSEVKCTLDKAVHGHNKAKKQIERIIGQWINGEQDGYCFGFEGPPGVGKTTLAKKGLSDCLKDENGIGRPFAMIQMGGDSNGSTLHGHNYTYVGSTWGSILQILIDKKCMNPIIFIDEVDKISRTEHGKEIVGILTHLLDPAQNDCFQDKYFTGIEFDLSKALFILSYNDVDAIDKILLDRVHRIKFNSLTLDDKLVISKTHILPEVYKKMGLEGIIEFDDETLKFIIDEYTLESGVRKLKEILFEIVGEINLDILKNHTVSLPELPICITVEDIKNKYFKDKKEILTRKVPDESIVGFANGMYANALGSGGTLPIHGKFFPSEQFLELKLTGLQQDVMKESMHVSLTIAWNLTSEERRNDLRILYDGDKNKYGINIHPGDASVHKDGPSAGVTITSVIYSLLNDKPIKAKIAMTGEIQMTGQVTAIGGLNFKIIGSIKSGVKEFIYPCENKKEFNKFYEKYKNDCLLDGIKFHPVNHIDEVFQIIF